MAKHEQSIWRSGICKDRKYGLIYRFVQTKRQLEDNTAFLLAIKNTDRDVLNQCTEDHELFDNPWGDNTRINIYPYNLDNYDILKVDKE